MTRLVLGPILPAIPLRRPPILVLGAGRSGTTWLAEMLARAPGVLPYMEPCNPDLNLRGRSSDAYWTPYLRPGADAAYFERHLDAAFGGRLHRSRRWSGPSWQYRLTGRGRVLVKEVAAVMLSGWTVKRYGPAVVFVHRHPCAVAASEVRRGRASGGDASGLLSDPLLAEDHLGRFETVLQESRSPLGVAAVYWAARNSVALAGLRDYAPLVIVSYERLAADPLAGFRTLYRQLGLAWTRSARDAVRTASTSETPGDYSTGRVSAEMVDRWRSQLTQAEADEVRRAVEPFKLPFYNTAGDFAL
jgi:LPS sulfotransferase NodH